MASNTLDLARDKLAKLAQHFFTYANGTYGSDAHVKKVESFLPEYVALAKRSGATTDRLYDWLRSVVEQEILPSKIADTQKMALFDMDMEADNARLFRVRCHSEHCCRP